MKKFSLIVLIFGLAFHSFAQDDDIQTVFSGDMSFGGYGGPVLKMTSVNDKLGLMVGGRGAVMINHQLALGGGGYGLTTSSKFDVRYNLLSGSDSVVTFNTEMGYGGFMMEYTLFGNKAVHVAFPLMIAGGGVTINAKDPDYFDPDNDFKIYNKPVDESAFFVLEPGVDVEFNILKFFRIGLGASYRYVTGTNLRYLTDSDLRDLSFNMTFKFGYF